MQVKMGIIPRLGMNIKTYIWNQHQVLIIATPKINIEPEHDGLEDDYPLPGGGFIFPK